MVFIWCVIIMGRWGDHNYRHAGGVITGDAPKNVGGGALCCTLLLNFKCVTISPSINHHVFSVSLAMIHQGAFRVQMFGDLQREFDKLQYYL
jgi:hypothetical protein